MLYIVGLGLGDEKDITLKGLEAIKSCTRIYLEAYTSILTVDKSRLEALYGKEVIIADREMVESQSDQILQDADKVNVAFLVVGDPFGATTHTDLVLRAKELNIEVVSIHNASIMNAVGACGLQLYNFGQAVSIVFFTETWRPDSFYPRILTNSQAGMHTLCLLDIKVKEQSIENMARFMSVYQAAQQLIEVELKNNLQAYHPDNTLAVGLARLGSSEQRMVCATLTQFAAGKPKPKSDNEHGDDEDDEDMEVEVEPIIDMGPPLHSLILVGKQLHFLEAQLLRNIAYDLDTVNSVLKNNYHAEE